MVEGGFMPLIDVLNSFGKRKRLKSFGTLLHKASTKISFANLTRVAGRRIVTAPAGAPAILLTSGNIENGLKDPQILFEAMRFTVEKMHFDTFCLSADLSVEVEACGCEVKFQQRDLPVVLTHPLREYQDMESLKVPDPLVDGRMPVFLETMRKIKSHYKMLKSAVVTGPFTQASHLIGPDIYTDTLKNPEKVKTVVKFCNEVLLSYSNALINAGADIIAIGEPSASLLSPSGYYEFSQSYTEETISILSKPCILHICGDTTNIVEMMCQSGAVAISIDEVDLTWLTNVAPKNVVIAGNLSTTALLNDTPEKVTEKTEELLNNVKKRKTFFVLPGCDLAPETPLENIKAFVRAVKEYP